MLKSSLWSGSLQEEWKGVDEVTPQCLTSALWPTLTGQVVD